MKRTDNGFKDEFSFLSNFAYFEKPFLYDGLQYKTNEHFYVAMKTEDKAIRKQVSEHPLKGVKKFGNSFILRPHWDDIKLDVMRTGLNYKFSNHNPYLRNRLIETEGIELVEFNYWNDTFWGVCVQSGYGQNMLGKILMEIRAEIISEENVNSAIDKVQNDAII